MTDEARIARLTEIARRVWPDAEIEADKRQVLVETSSEWGDAVTIKHPRALDALEAALLVLADQGRMDDPSPIEAAQRVRRPLMLMPGFQAEPRYYGGSPSLEQPVIDAPSEPPRVTATHVQNAADHVAEIKRLRAELDDNEPPAWVENLASEWEARVSHHNEAHMLRAEVHRCAAELRARAKGGP